MRSDFFGRERVDILASSNSFATTMATKRKAAKKKVAKKRKAAKKTAKRKTAKKHR